MEIAKEIEQTSPMSTFLNKQMIIRNASLSPEEAHLVESKSIYWTSKEADSKEGIMSFLEKREPKFPMDPFQDAPIFYPWWQEVQTKAKL